MSKVRDFLGAYRLARLIRLGSVCQVWEAIEEASNQRFALKVLRPEQRGNKEELGFLKWEYEVGSKLHHKNIINIKDFVTNADTPFLVLELFSELNVKMAIRRGPEGIAHMVDKIFLQTAESLYYLHSKGFIHCDVKPDNVLVDRNGEVKLIDFTIAQKKKTGLGRLFSIKPKLQGTRSYMSPEQIRQERMDERSDVYSLGCMFFELLTGKLPFTATSPNELLSKHLSAPVPSALVANENVSADFNAVMKSMMAKDPKDRPSSMYEVVKAVKGVKIFNRPPRLPEKSIFDDLPMGGRVENREQAEGSSKAASQPPVADDQSKPKDDAKQPDAEKKPEPEKKGEVEKKPAAKKPDDQNPKVKK